MQHSNSDPAETPSWLEQRQAMVWEPELLISGIVLFGLLQIPSVPGYWHYGPWPVPPGVMVAGAQTQKGGQYKFL
jgi:hypothetical protein